MAGKSQEWKAKTPCIHKTQLLFVHFHVLSWHRYEIKFTHCIIYLDFLSTNNHFEDLMRSSPPERSTGDKIYTDTGDSSHQSPYYSSGLSPHLSSGSASGSSPFSRHSSRKKGDVMFYIKIIEFNYLHYTVFLHSFAGAASDHSDGTLVEDQRSSCSPPSEPLSFESWKRGSSKTSVNHSKSVHSNDTSEKSSHKG